MPQVHAHGSLRRLRVAGQQRRGDGAVLLVRPGGPLGLHRAEIAQALDLVAERADDIADALVAAGLDDDGVEGAVGLKDVARVGVLYRLELVQ